MEPTSQQKQAIQTQDRNLVVVAGAGSGKTRVLVERYLHLLRSNPDWTLDSIVAITFTSKAAQEMRDRVRGALEKELNDHPDQRERWEMLLATMESARIDTIHALCATLLRANAAEAGVDPDFEVLDEIQASVMQDDALAAALNALVAENHPALELFVEYGERAVRESALRLMRAEVPPLPDGDLLAGWRAQWEQDARALTKHLSAFIAAGETYLPRGADALSNAWQLVHDVHRQLDGDGAHAALQTLVEARKPGKPSEKVWGVEGEDAKQAFNRIHDHARVVAAALGTAPNESDQRAAHLLPLWAELLRRARAAYQTAKTDASVLDFDDLESRTRWLLRDNPLVRARYQNAEFKHLLVDEFQDTNQAQWDIVQALAPADAPGTLFIVGDPKQSIYSFRGADVRVFETAQRAITAAGGARVPLATSFRTHQPLVQSFNALFRRVMGEQPTSDYEVRFEPMDAFRGAAPLPDAPVVELMLLDGERLPEDVEDKADEMRRWEARAIARWLRAHVTAGTPVFSKESGVLHPLRWGDVALLFQSLSNVTLYEDVFKTEGIPFVTVAGRGYYDRQEVWDVIHLLNTLHNPADNLSLAAVLRSPMFGVSDDALLALRLLRDVPRLWDALAQADVPLLPDDERPLVAFARQCLYELRALSGRMAIDELLREALSRTGYLATLSAMPDGARRRGNVEKLVERAAESRQVTLGAFKAYLQDLSAREAREGEAPLENEQAVTLMTVHASKGLEYPVVVLPDCSWTRGSARADTLTLDPQVGLACKIYDAAARKNVHTFLSRRAEQLDKQRTIAERKRLLYVAMTRAQDYLLISGNRSKRSMDDSWLGWLLDALEVGDDASDDGYFDLPAHNVRVHCPAYRPGTAELPDTSIQQASPARAGEPLAPPLLAKVRVGRDQSARFLTATQIAQLGSGGDREKSTFRRSVLRAAPESVQPVIVQTDDRPRASKRQLGDIVHEALRWWQFPGDTPDIDRLLDNYAWRHGVVDKAAREDAVLMAREWLQAIKATELYQRIADARRRGYPVYQELPFVFKTDKRTIHGIIDVLLRDEQGWSVIDYKTSYVDGFFPSGNRRLLEDHARRYHLQMGVYASAAREQLRASGQIITPSVFIHYIRYQQTIPIAPTAWQGALEQLEAIIGTLNWDEDDD